MDHITILGQNSNRLSHIQNQWRQKLKEQLSTDTGSAGKTTGVFRDTDKVQEISPREEHRSEMIHHKLLLGCELSDKELEFLKEKSPDLYDEYMASENARKQEEKAFRRALRFCSTREAVSRIKNMNINRCVARADEIAKNQKLSKDQKAIRLGAERRKLNDIYRANSEFMRSSRYTSLPSEKSAFSRHSSFAALQAYTEIASANAEDRMMQLAKDTYLSD